MVSKQGDHGRFTSERTERAILAGGCFWGMEDLLRQRRGVISTRVGYIGGETPDPTYDDHHGHAEAVEVVFDPAVLSYRSLLELFFQIHDPTTYEQQGSDVGPSYRSAIFATPAQRADAEASKAALVASNRLTAPVVTQVLPLARFYPAEEYHRDYAKKNAVRYNTYRVGCGRDARLRQVWKS